MTQEQWGLAVWNFNDKLSVCAKFWANESRDFGFRTQKPRRKFDMKSGLNEKRLKYGKNYFTGLLHVLRYPFIPTNSLLATMSFLFFFFAF